MTLRAKPSSPATCTTPVVQAQAGARAQPGSVARGHFSPAIQAGFSHRTHRRKAAQKIIKSASKSAEVHRFFDYLRKAMDNGPMGEEPFWPAHISRCNAVGWASTRAFSNLIAASAAEISPLPWLNTANLGEPQTGAGILPATIPANQLTAWRTPAAPLRIELPVLS